MGRRLLGAHARRNPLRWCAARDWCRLYAGHTARRKLLREWTPYQGLGASWGTCDCTRRADRVSSGTGILTNGLRAPQSTAQSVEFLPSTQVIESQMICEAARSWVTLSSAEARTLCTSRRSGRSANNQPFISAPVAWWIFYLKSSCNLHQSSTRGTF